MRPNPDLLGPDAEATASEAVPPSARRRRGAELEDAIFDAVLGELAEVGYGRLTMEGVAARAQTGKQVLYRRWPSRPELVLAAVRARTGSIFDRIPDTGSLRGDAVELMRHLAMRQRELGIEVIRGLLADAADLEPDSLTAINAVTATIIERAARRGEIGTAQVPAYIASVASDLLRYRILTSDQAITDRTIDTLVDGVFLPLVGLHAAGTV